MLSCSKYFVSFLKLSRLLHTSSAMAKSKFEYVRSFEMEDKVEPSVWILIKMELQNTRQLLDHYYDGKSFPSPLQEPMVNAAKTLMGEWKDVAFSYGYSTRFYFVLKKDSTIYKRRGSKWITNMSSLFTAALTQNVLRDLSLTHLQSLLYTDSKIYAFPQLQHLRNYLMSEQLDCHHLNLSQTAIHHLRKRGDTDAEERIRNMSTGEKNELLFSEFGVNYNNEPPVRRKGTILIRKSETSNSENGKRIFVCDLYKDFSKKEFWKEDFLTHESIQEKSSHFPHKSFLRRSHILPHAWLVVRIDGKGFHKFSEKHNFDKPNDRRSLRLMNVCALEVMKKFPSIVIAYGQSDEYSFVFRRYGHREKDGYSLTSRLVSVFSSCFVSFWKMEFRMELLYPPSFDGRVVFYPTNSSLKDYLSWRQVDCHINNMYNTCFWLLVNRTRLTRSEAQQRLSGTFSKDKLSILAKELDFDYAEEDPFYGKGSVLYRSCEDAQSEIVLRHTDIIETAFWESHPWILGEELQAKHFEEEISQQS